MLSWSMVSICVGMILFPLIQTHKLDIILSVFGTAGLFLSVRLLLNLNKPKELNSKWLGFHLGNMLGGYIATVTAFVVVNNVFIIKELNWLLPSLLGTIYIFYWLKKIKTR